MRGRFGNKSQPWRMPTVGAPPPERDGDDAHLERLLASIEAAPPATVPQHGHNRDAGPGEVDHECPRCGEWFPLEDHRETKRPGTAKCECCGTAFFYEWLVDWDDDLMRAVGRYSLVVTEEA